MMQYKNGTRAGLELYNRRKGEAYLRNQWRKMSVGEKASYLDSFENFMNRARKK